MFNTYINPTQTHISALKWNLALFISSSVRCTSKKSSDPEIRELNFHERLRNWNPQTRTIAEEYWNHVRLLQSHVMLGPSRLPLMILYVSLACNLQNYKNKVLDMQHLGWKYRHQLHILPDDGHNLVQFVTLRILIVFWSAQNTRFQPLGKILILFSM